MNVPEHLAEALRAAAGAAPPHVGDLAAVRRRGQARLRHRAVTATGLVAVAAAVAVGTPFLVAPEPEPGRGPVTAPPATTVQPTESAAPTPPAQPLLLNGSGWVADSADDEGPPDRLQTARKLYEWYRGRPGASGVLGPLAEIRPDGTVVDLADLPEIDSMQEMVAMPDGRLAAIGLVDLMPGVERTDGPCVAGIATPLLVVEPDRSVSVSRDLRVRCQSLRLVAADADTAYLLRDDRLVAHDLATGEERRLLAAAPTTGPGLDYAAGRLAALTRTDEPACGAGTIGRLVVRVMAVAEGASTDYPVPLDGCSGDGGPLRLSPDGRYAGYAYLRQVDGRDRSEQIGVAILDLADGTTVVDRMVAEVTGPDLSGTSGRPGVAAQAGGVDAGIVGLAWDDPQTLRLAWYEVPRDRVYWLPDVLQQTTIAVPAD